MQIQSKFLPNMAFLIYYAVCLYSALYILKTSSEGKAVKQHNFFYALYYQWQK